MEHVHEPVVQLNGLIVCRTCGKQLSKAEEQITIVSSYRSANKVLEEIAVAGHYTADSFNNHNFVVYSRQVNNNREEVTVEKISNRSYRVLKRIITGGCE